MKKILLVISVLLIGLLSACGSDGVSGDDSITIDDTIQSFKDAGLEVKNVSQADLKIPKADDGKIFEIQSLGKYNEVLVYSYDDETVLDSMKSFYDEMASNDKKPFISGRTVKHKNILLLVRGPNMNEETYNKYKKALEDL